MKKLLLCFAAGCLGALCSALLMWLAADFGFTQKMGLAITVPLTPSWLYPKIVWGGIWAELFALPLLKSKPVTRGMLFSLLPSATQLFYFLPYTNHSGVAGLKLGFLTPVWVLAFNLIWGIIAALTIRWSR